MKRYNNLKSSIMAMVVLAMTTMVAQASYPEGYYSSLNGKCGAELMQAVKDVAKNHKNISYGENTWKAFRSTDVRVVNGKECWWDMYSNNNVEITGHSGMNIEHSVAQSWWKGYGDAPRKTDIVHLNPSDATANNRKSNYPLGEVADVTWDNGVTFVGYPESGQGGGNKYVYEPHDDYKGDFARVFMYMFTIYSDLNWASNTDWMYDTSKPLMFKDWARDLLLKWHAGDPVSEKETKRNAGIYKEQQNRNPFIDLPALADHIWGSKSSEPFKVDESYEPNPDDPVDPDPSDPEIENTYHWLRAVDTDMGDWVIDNMTLPSGSTYVWSWKDYKGDYYLNGSAFISGTPYEAEAYAFSPTVSMKDVTKAVLTFDHAARFQTTCRDLCKFVVINQDVNEGAAGYMREYDITQWPTAGGWNFTTSEEFDLTEYTGHNIMVGFKYKSTAEGADTWEIRDVILKLTRAQSGVNDLPHETDDSDLVEVWGNNILVPEGAMIFDLNGRQVSGENLTPGLYIVVKPTFAKAKKIMIK